VPPRKKAKSPEKAQHNAIQGYIENAGVVVEQPIVDTLETNYMPYAMSVILSRAIPEIDGFKPSHRKILYTMYKMGLLSGSRTKSANIVGQTMRLNPHGDQAIYETMVRLSRGYEALLCPFVDSKGNFGKAYSRDMAFAASRYTEAKLEPVCAELFGDIEKDTVDFVPNYDNTTTEPVLLPVSFPNILVNNNMGIAVGMASNICSFNLVEVCETAAALIKDPKHDILSTLKAPDFPGGGCILYNEEELRRIYETGRGSVKVRSRYQYDKSNNCIEITEIPSTTTVEVIIDKVAEMVKSGKIREIADMRDETDLNGLKLTIDLKRGVDPDKLMQKLFRATALEDNFGCNFNILVGGVPQVMGVGAILEEWTAFRRECVRRRVAYELDRKSAKLHLLKGLAKILLDIDKAVRIVRETEEEREVVPNLMIGFGIDEKQAEFVAEIKLRHLNREHILKRTAEIESLEKEVADLKDILADRKRVDKIIIAELKSVAAKYGKPRRSEILMEFESSAAAAEEQEIPDYPVVIFFSREGYFKKITPQSLRMSGEQKLKEGDEIVTRLETQNNVHLLFFSDKGQVYKADAADFEDTKASVMGDYIPAKLGMDEGETAVAMVATMDYKGWVFFVFENGKAAKVELASYETKTKRRKLTGAYSTKSPLVSIHAFAEERDFLLTASSGRMLIVGTAAILAKASRDTQGVQVMSLRKNARVISCQPFEEGKLAASHRYRTRNLPGSGSLPRPEDLGEQLKL